MAGPPLPPKPRQYSSTIDDKFADVYNSLNKLTHNRNYSQSTRDSIYNLYGDSFGGYGSYDNLDNRDMHDKYSDTEYSPVNPNLSSMHQQHLVVGSHPAAVDPANRRAAVLPPPRDSRQRNLSPVSAQRAVPSRQTLSNTQPTDPSTDHSTLYSPSSFLTSEQPYQGNPLPSPLTGPSAQDNVSTYSPQKSPKLRPSSVRERASDTPLPHEVLAREDPYAHLQQPYNSPLAHISTDSFSSPGTSIQQAPSLYPPTSTPSTPQSRPQPFSYPSVQAQSSMHNAQLQSYVQSKAIASPKKNTPINKGLNRRTMDTSFPDDEYAEAYYDELQDDELQTGLRGFNIYSIVKPHLLKDLAVQFKDNVVRGTHVKGSVPFDMSFTGKDVVNTIRDLFPTVVKNSSVSRSLAVQVARTFQSQLYFFEVEFNMILVSDDVQEIFIFPDEVGLQGAGSDEIPTGVFIALTPCYSLMCPGDETCYSYSCPYRAKKALHLVSATQIPNIEEIIDEEFKDWTERVEPEILVTLDDQERERQSVIQQALESEVQYLEALDTIESLYIEPLRMVKPSIIPLERLESFIEATFAGLLALREYNRRLVEQFKIRQREQSGLLEAAGDIFLSSFIEWQDCYPDYVGSLPTIESMIREEQELNGKFRDFLMECERKPESQGMDLITHLQRPAHRLSRYAVYLNAILKETPEGHTDCGYLVEGMKAVKRLTDIGTLVLWQHSDPNHSNIQGWTDLVEPEVIMSLDKKEIERQNNIFELIRTEMGYVKDLERFTKVFIRPLRDAKDSIIPNYRIDHFIYEVFGNHVDLFELHNSFIKQLHKRQREQHPIIDSITDCVLSIALNWGEAYETYLPHYPYAKNAYDEEIMTNEKFVEFVSACRRLPECRRQDLSAFLFLPPQRLPRYPLLLGDIVKHTKPDHPDKLNIEDVIELIKSKIKEINANVGVATEKVKLRNYSKIIIHRDGSVNGLDLANDARTLVYEDTVIRHSEGTTSMTTSNSDIKMMLFDHYLVLCKEKRVDKVAGRRVFYIWKRPIPLDLLTLNDFNGPPLKQTSRIRGALGRGVNDEESGLIYPFSFIALCRPRLEYTLFTDDPAKRFKWQEKLEEALFLHSQVQEETNKVFEAVPLSIDTFPATRLAGAFEDNPLTGRVTCSVPFKTNDGRRLVAIGCAEGLWIGLRGEPTSLRRVLHLKNVTQCAVLEEFGMFIVLADKILVAYSVEALVPSASTINSGGSSLSRTPQKLSGTKDVIFFTVGKLHERTLVIFMKRKGMDSVFRAMEPVSEKTLAERAPVNAFNRLLTGGKSGWFENYQVFFIPSEATDLLFLRAKLAIICKRGFEIMDLETLKGGSIPDFASGKNQRDPQISALGKKCDDATALAIFKSGDQEFLLIYQQFGFFVDRHGDPHRLEHFTEWEGKPESVSCHPPYVLLFDSEFVEIREMETLNLVQVIKGNEIHRTWGGVGLSPHSISPNGWVNNPEHLGESRCHLVMRVDNDNQMSRGQRGTSSQRVFELAPIWHYNQIDTSLMYQSATPYRSYVSRA
ncbi:hypothetical protein E3P91_02323 [Wallemia ichthyophaga]|nr:hypothetical protein E3P91_02323 [Wallemia ichthyophaga]